MVQSPLKGETYGAMMATMIVQLSLGLPTLGEGPVSQDQSTLCEKNLPL